MRYFTQSLRISGYVTSTDAEHDKFTIRAFSGDEFEIKISDEVYFYMVRNTDKVDRDVSDPNIENKIARYLQPGKLVSVYGVHQVHQENSAFFASTVALFGDNPNHYCFEEGHWWLNQITGFADAWLERQFGNCRDFDFTTYRTNLTAAGTKIEEDSLQECDTISRLLYGLSSAYLLTGGERYLAAAKDGVRYQREMYRSINHDGSFVIWNHALRNGKKILASQFSDDYGTIPLYEQIYAIAGMTQYFKVTQDWETLQDILRSVRFFVDFYKDSKNPGSGFFSHVDPVNLRYDSARLGDNRSRKNWNSVGDHTPAYLLNLLLSLENIHEYEDHYSELLKMQREVADLVVEKFPDPNSPYVNERFFEDWTPDHNWRWQKNRAVVGHNLKIAWNLTRVYHLLGDKKYLELATEIARKMPEKGMDMIRGGWYDVVERQPSNGLPFEFTWHNRKAWWQQEQAILAYLVLAGSADKQQDREKFLQLGRESIAFWNLAFLDQDYGETYFDVLENGTPYIIEDRAKTASHSKSGYHSMELNYLSHVYYTLLINKKRPLCLHFCLSGNRTMNALNVLPDCLPRSAVKLTCVSVNGDHYRNFDSERFQVILDDKYRDEEVEVEVCLNAT